MASSADIRKFLLCAGLLLVFSALPALDRSRIIYYEGEISPSQAQMLSNAAAGRFTDLSLLRAYLLIFNITNEERLTYLESSYLTNYQQIMATLGGVKSKTELAKALAYRMHGKILKNYSFDAVYPEPLLVAGQFNCVSSSLIYADMLKRNGIGFEFAHVTRHVFVYAIPDGRKIHCEPTTPVGFDAGNSVITNDDGSFLSAPDVRYESITPGGEADFIAGMTYDGRLAELFSTNARESYILTKNGLYISPDNGVMITNFISAAARYLNELTASSEMERAFRICADTVSLIHGTKIPKDLFLKSTTDIAKYYIVNGQKDKVAALMSSLSQPGDQAFARQVIEKSYLLLASDRIQAGKSAEAAGILKEGLGVIKSDGLQSYLNNVEMLLAGSIRDMDAAAAKYQELLARTPGDAQVKNNYVAVMMPLLLAAVKAGEYEKANRHLGLVSQYCGTALGEKTFTYAYGNGILELLNMRLFARAFEAGLKGMAYSRHKSVEQNTVYAFSKYLDDVYQNQGLIESCRLLVASSAAASNEAMTARMAEMIQPLFYQDLLKNDPAVARKALDLLAAGTGAARADAVVASAFNNSLYQLCRNGDFERALQAGEAALDFNPQADIQRNYVYMIQEYCRNRIRQKDPAGAMEVLCTVMKNHPAIKDLQTLPKIVFGDYVVDMIKHGDMAGALKIVGIFQKLNAGSDLFDNVFINASYELYQEKNYQQAEVMALKGLDIRYNAQLFENFQAALQQNMLQLSAGSNAGPIFDRYAAMMKKFPKATGLQADLGGVIRNHCQVAIRSQNYQLLAPAMKKLKPLVNAEIYNQSAESAYVNATYELNRTAQYDKAIQLAEEGLQFTPSPKLTVNYMNAVWNAGKTYADQGKKSEANKVLARAKKLYPNHEMVKQLETYLAGKK